MIANEVYGHLVFGGNPFVPMNVFGSTMSIITLGSISNGWMVLGWQLGWLALSDLNGFLKKYGLKV